MVHYSIRGVFVRVVMAALTLKEYSDEKEWMSKDSEILGSMRVCDVMLPGTHDTMTYSITAKSAYSPDRPNLPSIVSST